MKFSLEVKMPDDASSEVIEEMTRHGIRQCHRQAARKAHVISRLTCTPSIDIIKDSATKVMKLEAESEITPFVVIVSDTKIAAKDAIAYGRTVWPGYEGKIRVVTRLTDFDVLYGRTNIPYNFYPNTVNLACRSWLAYHEKAGRIIRVESPKPTQTTQMAEPLAEA